MANEVVLHTEIPYDPTLKPGDLCVWGQKDSVFLAVYHGEGESGDYKIVDLDTGGSFLLSTKDAGDLTPLGPCRIEVTPC